MGIEEREEVAERIVLLPGDGIGPEVTEQARLVLEAAGGAAGIEFEFVEESIGGCSIDAHGTPLRDEVIELCRSSRAVLLGAVGGPKWDDMPVDVRPEKGLLGIRKALGLFANLRPAAVLPALVDASALRPEIVSGVDMLVVRELTGGIYFGEPRGRSGGKGSRSATNAMAYHEDEVERIARVAFEQARLRRNHVTHVHKANVLDVSQLWVEVVDEVAMDYPDVELAHQLVDSCAMLLVQEPKRFDVIVTGNLFGDILSDEAAMITGSLGMLPSASLAEGGFGLFEPVHGSAPDIAGKDIANPLAAIQSVAMLLETAFPEPDPHAVGAKKAAAAVRKAVADVLGAGHRSGDLLLPGETRETVGCRRMGELVLEALGQG
jgi:3-isopropylmalate dehydrogenase